MKDLNAKSSITLAIQGCFLKQIFEYSGWKCSNRFLETWESWIRSLFTAEMQWASQANLSCSGLCLKPEWLQASSKMWKTPEGRSSIHTTQPLLQLLKPNCLEVINCELSNSWVIFSLGMEFINCGVCLLVWDAVLSFIILILQCTLKFLLSHFCNIQGSNYLLGYLTH